ncbi:MAG: hypothetical protein VKN72_23885 [Nostocales cyanobacterium 94392]|nr:hypothetical protein [Nostocales cyanobacterium 94392]
MKKARQFLLKRKARLSPSKLKQIIKFWQILAADLRGLIIYRDAMHQV